MLTLQKSKSELQQLEELYQKHGELSLDKRDDLIRRLRDADLPLAAERVLLSCFDPLGAREDSRLGWPFEFPKKPAEVWEQIKSRPNLDLYLIPKFRGIHYRSEPTSRFSSPEVYKEHVKRDEQGEPTFSPATYKMAPHFDFKKKTTGRRPTVKHVDLHKYDPNAHALLKKSGTRLRRRMQRMGFAEGMSTDEFIEEFIAPALVQDIIERQIHQKRHQTKRVRVDKKKRTVPRKQKSQSQYEQQIYVNQYGTYERALPKLSLLPGITQISTSDNPYHAAMYAFGAKFSTKEELEAKKKEEEETGNNVGERRTTGDVGKIYTYLFSPDDLYRLEPNVVPVMLDQEEVSIKPLQQWEVETTFFGETPGQYLVAQDLATIPKDEQDKYTTKEKTGKGQYHRQKFSRGYAPRLWKQAESIANEKRKLLVPHGVLMRMFGDDESLKGYLAELREEQKKRQLLALEQLKSQFK